MPNSSLAQLLEGLVAPELIPQNIIIKNLSLDSRSLKPGDLFFAYPGFKLDRRNFIDEAISKGAVAILAEIQTHEEPSLEWKNKIPLIKIKDVQMKVSEIAGRFYGNPSRSMKVIGITGTSGKTSCSQLLAQAFELLHQKAGVIGTLGHGLVGHLTDHEVTTPDPITIQSILAQLLKQSVKVVTMETSSHSLQQGRENGVNIETGIFMNLARDHFDYHGTVEAYAAAKRKLFEMPTLQQAIFNIDDPYGHRWAHEFHTQLRVCSYGLKKPSHNLPFPVVIAKDIQTSSEGLSGIIKTPWGEGQFTSSLIGFFNVTNLLAVTATLGLYGYPFQSILNLIPQLKPIPGRMQVLGGKDKPLIVIDFAHKPDALENVLKALRQHCTGQLICVFGCGGNKDRGKRPIMGKIAEDLADRVIITNDNVRLEKQEDIARDILEGFSNPNAAIIEYDRKKAIQKALSIAKAGDIILLAGKGHETTQTLGDKIIPFSEEKIVTELLK